ENCSLTLRFSPSRRRLVDLYKVVMEQFLPLVVAIVNGLRAPRSNKKRTPTRQKQEDFDLRGRYENSICRSGPSIARYHRVPRPAATAVTGGTTRPGG